jgi:hypothetical protein
MVCQEKNIRKKMDRDYTIKTILRDMKRFIDHLLPISRNSTIFRLRQSRRWINDVNLRNVDIPATIRTHLKSS